MMKDSFPVGTKISSASFIANILLSNDAENAMIAISDISTKSILVGHDDLLYCRRMIQQLTPTLLLWFHFRLLSGYDLPCSITYQTGPFSPQAYSGYRKS